MDQNQSATIIINIEKNEKIEYEKIDQYINDTIQSLNNDLDLLFTQKDNNDLKILEQLNVAILKCEDLLSFIQKMKRKNTITQKKRNMYMHQIKLINDRFVTFIESAVFQTIRNKYTNSLCYPETKD